MANQIEVKRLQRNLLRKREQVGRLHTECQLLKQSLQGICDHSQTEDYRWEHDNGYGRQSMHTGKRCVFCGWIRLHEDKYSEFIDPKQLTI